MTNLSPVSESVLGDTAWSSILWDLDGTISDSAEEITARISKSLRLAGFPTPSLADLRQLIGPPLYEGYTEILGLTHDQALQVLDAQRHVAELEGLGQRSSLYRGVSALLAELHGLGMPMGIASSKGEHQVVHITDHFKIAQYFDVRVGSIERIGRMSKTDVIGEALRQMNDLGFDTSRTVMIGDRIHDLEGATAHGLPAIIVGWGYHNGESSEGALARVERIEELRELLLGHAFIE